MHINQSITQSLEHEYTSIRSWFLTIALHLLPPLESVHDHFQRQFLVIVVVHQEAADVLVICLDPLYIYGVEVAPFRFNLLQSCSPELVNLSFGGFGRYWRHGGGLAAFRVWMQGENKKGKLVNNRLHMFHQLNINIYIHFLISKKKVLTVLFFLFFKLSQKCTKKILYIATPMACFSFVF